MFKPYKYQKRYTVQQKSFFNFSNIRRKKIVLRSLVSFVLIFLGIGILFQKFLLPIAISYAKVSENAPIDSPLAGKNAVNLSANITSKDKGFVFNELTEGGITHTESEHEKLENKSGVDNIPEFFYLTIPKLDIYDAKVVTNSLNLNPKDAVGHFKGSCLPNEACNTFLFGHSTFKSVKNNYEKGDYKQVFSRLNELEYGDEFYITYNGKKYRYMVDFSKIDEPLNVDPLENPYPKSLHVNSITLFTCDPPGTTKYRLSVVARLVD